MTSSIIDPENQNCVYHKSIHTQSTIKFQNLWELIEQLRLAEDILKYFRYKRNITSSHQTLADSSYPIMKHDPVLNQKGTYVRRSITQLHRGALALSIKSTWGVPRRNKKKSFRWIEHYYKATIDLNNFFKLKSAKPLSDLCKRVDQLLPEVVLEGQVLVDWKVLIGSGSVAGSNSHSGQLMKFLEKNFDHHQSIEAVQNYCSWILKQFKERSSFHPFSRIIHKN